jgi:hypothetical protein
MPHEIEFLFPSLEIVNDSLPNKQEVNYRQFPLGSYVFFYDAPSGGGGEQDILYRSV